MLPGGDGFYYFSTFLLVNDGELGRFEIKFNGETVCYAHAEQRGTTTDEINTSCSAIVYGTEGKKLNVSYFLGAMIYKNIILSIELLLQVTRLRLCMYWVMTQHQFTLAITLDLTDSESEPILKYKRDN